VICRAVCIWKRVCGNEWELVLRHGFRGVREKPGRSLTAEYARKRAEVVRRKHARGSASLHHVWKCVMWRKRERAYGGCLGVKCRRRTWYTAKSPDEACAAITVGDVRMGKPGPCQSGSSRKRREPGELKHLSSPRKREDSASSGERKRRSPNRRTCRAGL
jgi:hypothetical protein